MCTGSGLHAIYKILECCSSPRGSRRRNPCLSSIAISPAGTDSD